MTEKLLRNALKEAQDKKQLGLFIWANWTVWDDIGLTMKEGNENYDFALSQVSNKEEATIWVEWNGLTMAGTIAVSAEKLSSSNEFFSQVIKFCEKNHYEGPITLLPLNELVPIENVS